MTHHRQEAARPLRRRSLLGLLGAAPLTAAVPATRALQSGRLLTPAFAELMLSGKFPVSQAQATGEPAAQSISIGYGVENLIVNNQRVFGHPGGALGVNTGLNVYPGAGWVAAVLGNHEFVVADLLELQNQLITQSASCAEEYP